MINNIAICPATGQKRKGNSKKMKKKILYFLIFVLILGILGGCNKNPSEKNFRYWIPSEPVTLDPQIATGNTAQILIDNLYEGLVRLDARGSIIPGMATKWEVSADRTVYTFYISHNTRWSDDKSLVTSDDFLFGIQRALDPETRSTTCEPLYCIKNGRQVNRGQLPVEALGVRAPNTFTLEITLEKPIADFLEITMLAPFMPCNRALFESSNGKYGLETETTHSNGPFRVAKNQGWRHDTSIRVVQSELYRGYQEVVPAQITFLIDNYPTAPLDALKDFKYDALEITQEQAVEAKEKEMTVLDFDDTTWALSFNTSSTPLSNSTLRKALVSCIDRQALFENLSEGHDPADSLLPPITTFYGKPYSSLESGVTALGQDEEKSREFRDRALEELGLSQLPTIEILVLDDSEHKLLGSTVLQYWKEVLGQSMNLNPVSTLEELEEKVLAGDYQSAIIPLQAEKDGPYSFLSMFSSGSIKNSAFLKSAQYDSLLTKAEGASQDTEAAAYFEAEKYLNESAVLYPIYYQGRYYALAPTVTDVVFRPFKNSVDFILSAKTAD